MDMNLISAVQKYAASKPATQPDPKGVSETSLGKVAIDFAQTLANSEAAAKQAMIGDADPHALVQALAQTELAVETAVTVRNKVVEAYQEILRMPV
ncbi:Flagellar hook-basal body complex protein FliE [Ascidiaceihabitans donghaensis]|uniref:Flagellar hook-basal body complex protein FliE n=1 Tax=Ascidiaceihabitans donghaensis TaxID=1510460 RepID=A0A2R8B8L1_9RHOB|nr:flagellar hook-basal body complex protein FliE [Ascidiaceihabitans donghaensis]SPH19348.1 Flagellar hook-basal body complex protein FliE [Ascidiaceihabitans donghaensis]